MDGRDEDVQQHTACRRTIIQRSVGSTHCITDIPHAHYETLRRYRVTIVVITLSFRNRDGNISIIACNASLVLH